ncbi:MAG: hypothetical protein PHD21_02210 [Flavobacteriales bacterium]|nr:hypothetical protein [Flavobacteriales bacterium]
MKTPSGETAVSDTAGHYAIKINKKDKYIRTDIDYTEGAIIRIPSGNKGRD